MEENKKNKIPNVPNLRFPFFTTQWIKIKVGDYYDVQMCRRIFANQTKEFGDVPFYKIGTLGNNADAYISKELFEEYKRKYNYPIIGETLITCSGTVGRCVQFDGKPSYYQDSNIVWLRKKSDLIANNFLFRLIQQKDWSKLNTTTISRIYNADLLSLKFYIPASKKEQEKITSFLDLIDERIRTQNKIIEKYESLINQIRRVIKLKYLEAEKTSLSELCSIKTGKKDANESSKNGRYPFFTCGRETLSIDTYSFEGKALLVSGNGEIGQVKYYDGKFDAYQRTYVLQNFLIKPKYIKIWLETLLPKIIEKEKNVGAMPYIVVSTLANIKIPKFSTKYEDNLISLFQAFENKMQECEIMLKLYHKQKYFLLSNLFI